MEQTKNFDATYDAVVVGAGHAGCEAALALAKKNNKTLLLTLNLDAVGFLPCNPSIGGTAKGHLVCEIDALGGAMGKVADKSTIQLRMLNASKGPAVHSLRAQVDKQLYHNTMKQTLENEPNLHIKQAEVKELLTEGNKIVGVSTCQGESFGAKAVVLCCGVYLNSKIIAGEYTKKSGPNGFLCADNLTSSLQNLGIEIRRFKTGTPARLNGNNVDFSKMVEQKGDDDIQTFNFENLEKPNNVVSCYLTYTNKNTHNIIQSNIKRAPMFSGVIKGVGPRYCPSIEDKITRFADKEKHQVFIEPEGLYTKEIYVQGVSTSLPVDVQRQMYKSIEGLENAEVMRDAYAIEYDLINSFELNKTLAHKVYSNLFFAGQINGTSGYEEAAAQGLIAGINASLLIENKPQLVLNRDEAYIGVLIDDLITKGTNEPYRMMTSRAEYRLVLRQDNADSRLTQKGYEVGTVSKEKLQSFEEKQNQIAQIIELCKKTLKVDEKLIKLCTENNESVPTISTQIEKLIKRSNLDIFKIDKEYNLFSAFRKDAIKCANIEMKYEGYIKQEQEDIAKFKREENILIPQNFDYNEVVSIRAESRQKLNKIRPTNIGQASRISGVSPADVTILLMHIKNKNK